MKNSTKKLFALSCISLAVCAAHAQSFVIDDEPEIRLLGPTFSSYKSGVNAPLVDVNMGLWNCRPSVGAALFCIDSQIEKRKWNQNQFGVGVEISTKAESEIGGRDLYFFQSTTDGYGKAGFQAGLGHSWLLASVGRFQLTGGVTGGVWYRGVSDGDVRVDGTKVICTPDMQPLHPPFSYAPCSTHPSASLNVTQVHMGVVPFIQPFLAVEDSSGLGARISYMPKGVMTPVETVNLQLTYKASVSDLLDKSDSGQQVRILGPALMRHRDASSAPFGQKVHETWQCGTGRCDVVVQNSRAWNENAFSTGLELSEPTAAGTGARNLYFVQSLTDGYGQAGLQAGFGRSWPLASAGRIQFTGGLTAGLWYRAVADSEVNASNFSTATVTPQDGVVYRSERYQLSPSHMGAVPFIQPFLAVEDSSGLGARMTLIQDEKTPALMLQATYKISF